MDEVSSFTSTRKRTIIIIAAYPFGVLIVGLFVNTLIGIRPLEVSLPNQSDIVTLLSALVLLIVNHSWLMTSTELTRLRYALYATPEEWQASGTKVTEASDLGLQEIQRHHNAHRNTTENVVYFAMLCPIFLFTNPSEIAQQIWLLSFAFGRLGYTYSYLAGKDNLRGVFMTVSLCALYGITSYLVLSCFM